MASLEEIRQNRIQKLQIFKKENIEPYPIESFFDYTLEEITLLFSKLSKKKKAISLVGRIMSIRQQGGLIFFNINDGTGSFQGLLKKDNIEDKVFDFFSQATDIGDYIEIKGNLFLTKRKEKTLMVNSWKMLAKSLRPLPEKWHGLQDVEERFRKRYLDSLMNMEVRDRFIIRSRIITEIRKFLDKAQYLEVETPALHPLYGGASAMPFITHHNVLDMNLYLRISDELYLKRMLIGGFPKVYEIARDFRNEGIDATHNPEFTMVEFYESFSSASKQMKFVEKLLKTIIKNIFKKVNPVRGHEGSQRAPLEIPAQARAGIKDSLSLTGRASTSNGVKINYNNQEIDFSKKFSVVSYYDIIRRYALIPNLEAISKEELAVKATQLGVQYSDSDSFQKILDNIYKKNCRSKILQPTFIIDYPADYLPLAKRKSDNQMFVDAFQLVVGGIELLKAFSELNDPIDQRERFMHQEKIKDEGEADTQALDEDFIEAMEYGMPPSGGVGIGIDRLVMLLTDTHNIKEIIYFPTLRPRSE